MTRRPLAEELAALETERRSVRERLARLRSRSTTRARLQARLSTITELELRLGLAARQGAAGPGQSVEPHVDDHNPGRELAWWQR